MSYKRSAWNTCTDKCFYTQEGRISPNEEQKHPVAATAEDDMACKTTSSDVCQSPAEEKCVMFSSVFSRYLCERPWIE